MSLCAKRFRISPNSFFQVNTEGAEHVYQFVCDWALATDGADTSNTKTNTIVLDICCGTGTIGICVAGVASLSHGNLARVVGIEMVAEAIEDAKVNAEENKINENMTFLVGKVEDHIDRVLTLAKEKCEPNTETRIVAIVDPPRSGLRRTIFLFVYFPPLPFSFLSHLIKPDKKVLHALRAATNISRLIYVSCNQEALIRDAATLCRPPSNTLKGREFTPIKVCSFYHV